MLVTEVSGMLGGSQILGRIGGCEPVSEEGDHGVGGDCRAGGHQGGLAEQDPRARWVRAYRGRARRADEDRPRHDQCCSSNSRPRAGEGSAGNCCAVDPVPVPVVSKRRSNMGLGTAAWIGDILT